MNPLFQSNRTTPTRGTAPGQSINDANKKYSQGYNTFNYDRHHYFTARYGDITPFEVVEGIGDDHLEFGCSQSTRSTSALSSALESKIYEKNCYYMVDMQAILPINWKKVFMNPNKGDDVLSNVNTYANIFEPVLNFVGSVSTIVENGNVDLAFTNKNDFSDLFRFVFLLESLFSKGSILKYLGFSSFCVFKPGSAFHHFSFDKAFDILMSSLRTNLILAVGNNPLLISLNGVNSDGNIYSLDPENLVVSDFSHFIDVFRENYSTSVLSSDISDNEALRVCIRSLAQFISDIILTTSCPINYSRVIAYQLCCAQFYTDDKIDDIYTAELYRENARSIVFKLFNAMPTFSYNGLQVEYDVFSGYIFNQLSSLTTGTFAIGSFYRKMVAYYEMIFNYRKSLRFGDYFTGARTQPYAVGDITAPVVSNGVSAIDMTRNILRQRFFNQVSRVGNSWDDYNGEVTDGYVAPDVTIPRWLCTKSNVVGSYEVENTTSDNLGQIATILRSTSGDYVYSVDVGTPCIIIGLKHFEVERVYSDTSDKFFFHEDRFDMFNKFMQFDGDQSIEGRELSSTEGTAPFAYTIRHMEYKKRFPIASGGFVEYLPSYLFVTDNDQGQPLPDATSNLNKLTPWYIHSKSYELDRFFQRLSNYSLAGRFHFIISSRNNCTAKRRMQVSPSIL